MQLRVLAIETSCDETAAAILECEGGTEGASYKVLGNALYSQAPLHSPYGGVYPNLAKREHIKNLPILLDQAMHEAGNPTVDLIAVTVSPGLEPALWTGIEFAKSLGEKLKVPVTGVDHMEGHLFSALLKKNADGYTIEDTRLPLLALLISGGHTELLLMREWFTYELIGRTKDDAVGEAFDKVARALGLAYPGGPIVSALAKERRDAGHTPSFKFPRPMAHTETCDFSFSGLKTAVVYKLKEMPDLTDDTRAEVAHAFEDAVRDVIVLKTKRALQETGAQTLAVGGGVSANTEIKVGLEDLVKKEFPRVTLAFPDPTLTGDNAIMIGVAAHLRASADKTSTAPLTAKGATFLERPQRVTDRGTEAQ